MPTPDEQVNADKKEVYTPPEIVWVGDAAELTAGVGSVFGDGGDQSFFDG
jgi:hypothetical protein